MSLKSCDQTRYNTFARTFNVIENVRVDNAFLIEMMLILKAIKSHGKGSYDKKQNLNLVVISYEIYKTRRRLVL